MAASQVLIRAIFADEPVTSGEIKIYGQSVHATSPHDVKRLRVGFVPEDRKADGQILDMSGARRNLASCGCSSPSPSPGISITPLSTAVGGIEPGSKLPFWSAMPCPDG
ncbi:MAG TPA: hypothetical protein VKV37_01075 [Ktedonobacteraceae bacterium]|nr:hypothetical protein [Ktedonobacteraceae bacterium]